MRPKFQKLNPTYEVMSQLFFCHTGAETVSQWLNVHVCHSEFRRRRDEESNKNKTMEQRDSSAKASE